MTSRHASLSEEQKMPQDCSVEDSEEHPTSWDEVSPWAFGVNGEIEEYCIAIAAAMVDLFEIPLAEAVARMNEHWAGQSLAGELRLVFHEEPDVWAKHICYHFGAMWWANEPVELEAKAPPARELIEAAQRHFDACPEDALRYVTLRPARPLEEGRAVFELDGRKIRDRAGFFAEVKRNMPLDPPLVGSSSWDALADSLWEGLRNLPESHIDVVWHDVGTLHEVASSTLCTAVAILHDVATSLEDSALLVGAPKTVRLIPDLNRWWNADQGGDSPEDATRNCHGDVSFGECLNDA